MKNKPNRTLKQIIFRSFLTSNIVGVILILLAPLIILNIFFFIQYVTLYNTVEMNVTNNEQIFEYAIHSGFSSDTFTLDDYIATQSGLEPVCTVSTIELLYNGIEVEYQGDCAGDYYTISKNIIKQSYLYYILTISVIIGAYLTLSWLRMKNIEQKIIKSFDRVNEEIKKIESLTGDKHIIEEEPIEEFKFILNEVKVVTEQISEYNLDKNELISLLSHELKTPLTTINAAVQLNELGIDEYKESIFTNKIITAEVDKINKAIDYSLALYASIGNSKVLTREFDVSVLLENVLISLNMSDNVNTDIISEQFVNNKYETCGLILTETFKNLLQNSDMKRQIKVDCKFKEIKLDALIESEHINDVYNNIKFTESACKNLGISYCFTLEENICKIIFKF